VRRSSETLDDIGFARTGLVLKGDEEAAFVDGFSGGIVVPGPGVDVHDVVGGDDEMAGVADAVGEDGGAKAARKL
jgi:hypothetical protein